ncbi:hypothetical protein Tco_0233781 [Tanacetum coccineum]
MSRFLRWVEAEKVSFEVESGKWRRLLLRKICVAFDVSTDGREEDFLLEVKCSCSIVVSIPDIVKDYNKERAKRLEIPVEWLVPSCCVIFDLEPFLVDFVFNSEIFKSFPCLS